MRKHRNWLMGLGIGLILGASMLQLILVAQDKVSMVANEPLTREQLNVEAQKAGLVLLTEQQLNAKVDEAVAAAVEANENSGEPGAINDSDAALKPPGTTKEEAASEATNPEEAVKPTTDNVDDEQKVTLFVNYGMTLTEVAEKLEELGVIEDADDFINHAWDISKKMSVGDAIFIGKPSYEQIKEELIRDK